jgi:diketogulonate reductase-like aldo/keto reductase
VLALGVSNYTVGHLSQLWQLARIKPSNLQVEIHPLNWASQKPLVEWCRERGMTVTAYSSLGVGELLKDEVLPELGPIAERHGRSKSQVLLRWAIQHGLRVIPKASSDDRVVENAGVFDWELDGEAMATLDAVSADDKRRKKFCWDPECVE